MMYRKEPIYITPKDTCIAEDKIKPYNGRIRRTSEQHIKEAVARLWGINGTNQKSNG